VPVSGCGGRVASGGGGGRHGDAGSGVGVWRVERLGVQQRARERVDWSRCSMSRSRTSACGWSTSRAPPRRSAGRSGRAGVWSEAHGPGLGRGWVGGEHCDRAEFLAHAPASDRVARDRGQLLEVGCEHSHERVISSSREGRGVARRLRPRAGRVLRCRGLRRAARRGACVRRVAPTASGFAGTGRCPKARSWSRRCRRRRRRSRGSSPGPPAWPASGRSCATGRARRRRARHAARAGQVPLRAAAEPSPARGRRSSRAGRGRRGAPVSADRLRGWSRCGIADSRSRSAASRLIMTPR
jgi:hypothetical protein